MKTLIIYSSQTGFTKKYAEWIAEEMGASCITLKEAKKKNLQDYDNLVYGGWCCAGGVKGLKWLKEKLPSLHNKKIALFAVGASPLENNPEVLVALRNNFEPLETETIKGFYCPGGFNYDKMSMGSKLAMKMFISILKKNKNPTEQDKKMIEMISHSYDISDKKYIEPIVQFLQN